MRTKTCGEIESEFYFKKRILYLFHTMNVRLYKKCSKTHELEDRLHLYNTALGSFTYHIKVEYKCLDQFLINLTLLISIRQFFEVLKQRHFKNITCRNLSRKVKAHLFKNNYILLC